MFSCYNHLLIEFNGNFFNKRLWVNTIVEDIKHPRGGIRNIKKSVIPYPEDEEE